MMNRIICVMLLAGLSTPALAGLDDARLDLAITEFYFEVFEGVTRTYDSIMLDIEQSPRVFKANGALKYTADDDGFPVTGTCAVTRESTVFCAIDASFATLYLELDGALNGTCILNGADGVFIIDGAVFFSVLLVLELALYSWILPKFN